MTPSRSNPRERSPEAIVSEKREESMGSRLVNKLLNQDDDGDNAGNEADATKDDVQGGQIYHVQASGQLFFHF